MISRCPFLLCQGNNRIIIFRLQVFSQVILFAWTACCKLCVVFQDKKSNVKRNSELIDRMKKTPESSFVFGRQLCKKLHKRLRKTTVSLQLDYNSRRTRVFDQKAWRGFDVYFICLQEVLFITIIYAFKLNGGDDDGHHPQRKPERRCMICVYSM